MEKRGRLLVVAPVVALLAFLSLWSVRSGMSEALALPAREEVRSWDAAHSAPSLDTWTRVNDDLQRAAELAPGNPLVYEVLGYHHLWRSGSAEFPQSALARLTRAAALRPTSPYTWGNLLDARYRLGLTQAPFERMLVETWRLGPAEPFVQRIVADLGLALWDEVGPETRAAVEGAVGAGMRRNPPEMLAISQRRGRLSPACGYVQGDKRLAQSSWLKACGV